MSQTKGLKRDTIDKFYTKPNIVNKCIENIKHYIEFHVDDIIIEPSAGNGSFIPSIKTLGVNNYKFYDIKPEHPDIINANFLELSLEDIQNKIPKIQNIHIMGNPPFGRQSSLAIQFIKHSAKFANSISFILPKSFKKDSLRKSFPLNFHLKYECDLPNNAFLVNGEEYDVPCIFQIWIKEDSIRNLEEKIESIGYKFVKHTESPHLSVRRVGVYAGKVDRDLNKSIQSHYFIKINNEKILQNIQPNNISNNISDNVSDNVSDNLLNSILDKFIEKLNKIEFSEINTVGPRSISRQEFIKKYNKIFSE